jgi:hypothetical protein
MAKKVIIEFSLVEESSEKRNEELEKEILDGLSEGGIIIPWCDVPRRVTVRGT